MKSQHTAHTYTWDARNRLSSSAGKTFYYNAGGSRYKIVDSSSATPYTYYVSPLYELREGTTTDDGNPTYYIFAGGQRIAALEDTDLDGNLENSERSYYHQDHLGGTALVTDSTGVVTQLYDYYPYGSELLDSQPTGASVPAEHSFTDKELDDDLGLYYFEARWYDSDIGRFASTDAYLQLFDTDGKNKSTQSCKMNSSNTEDDETDENEPKPTSICEFKKNSGIEHVWTKSDFLNTVPNLNSKRTDIDPTDVSDKKDKEYELSQAELAFQYLMTPQRLNTYSYSVNNPLRYVDPEGNMSEEAAILIVGGAAVILIFGPAAVTVAGAYGAAAVTMTGGAGIIFGIIVETIYGE